MRTRIERDWSSQTARIWFYEPRENGSIVRRMVGPDTWKDEVVEHGALLPEPSLILHEEALESLLREASGVLPPTDATTRHLEDTITIRDRLLALVEKRK